MSKDIIFRDCKTGADFENRVATYLSILGFMTNKTGRNDGGIDIVATKTIHENEYMTGLQSTGTFTMRVFCPVNTLTVHTIWLV